MKYLTLFALSMCLFGCYSNPKPPISDSAPSVNSQVVIVEKGQPLSTEYFDVTLNRYKIMKMVNAGNPYLNIHSDPDSKFLVMEVKYKNTNSESRMIGQGQVVINYNGKDYTYDHPEQVLSNRWATGLEQLNPLTSLTTYIAYRLPKELSGVAFFHPGRTDNNLFIKVGEVK